MPADFPLLVALVLTFVAAVFLAAAETALLRVGPARAAALREEGRGGAKRLERLVERLPQVLNTILLAALLAQIFAATITGILMERWFGSLGVTIGSIVLTLILFIYAEAIPKTYAVRHADGVALRLSAPIATLELALRPIVTLLIQIADMQAPGRGIATAPTVTEAELRRLAGFAVEEGQIETIDAVLIERAFRFGDRRIDDVMVPRTDIVGVATETPVATAIERALDVGHRRLVVFDGSLDRIVGVVRLRDLAAIPNDRRELPVSAIAMEPLVVPESASVVSALRQMQETGIHLAIAIDEHGGTAGMLTVEDIVEELLGSIAVDEGEPDLVQIDDATWSISGRLPVEDLKDEIGVEIVEGDWNTAAGLVIGLLGRFGHVGDTVELGTHRLRVTAVRQRRIHRIQVVDTAGER